MTDLPIIKIPRPLEPSGTSHGVPSVNEARARLAEQLAHGDVGKFTALLSLPLFDVALDGREAL